MTTPTIDIPAAPAGTPLWQHVRQSLIDMIRKGELAPGQALPPHGELCAQTGVGHVTMQRTLASLADEGWIVRYRRRGTFISDPLPKLQQRIVAVIPRFLLDTEPSMSSLIYARGLATLMREDGQPYRFYPEHSESFRAGGELSLDNALIDDVEAGRVEGLFVCRLVGALCDADSTFRRKLLDHDVPVIAVGLPQPQPCAAASCAFDVEAFFDRAFNVMRNAQRKRVGVVHVDSLPDVMPFGPLARKAAERCGMADAMVDIPAPPPPGEAAGFQAITAFGKQRCEQLDGLIVNDDIVAKGVAGALVVMGVGVPDPLLIVAQSNREYEVAYPLPIAKVEYSLQRLLRTAWDQFKQVKDGFRPAPRHALVPPEDALVLPEQLKWLEDQAK